MSIFTSLFTDILNDGKTVLKKKEIALGFWVAAIRELFEEIGILLAYQDNKLIQISSNQIIENFQKYREKLVKKEISMLEIMEGEGLLYAIDQLHYFRHFITPPVSPIRFDARFFFTKLPEMQKQQIKLYSGEIAEFKWLTPKESLRKYRKGEIKIIAPQYFCLKELMNNINIQEDIKGLF